MDQAAFLARAWGAKLMLVNVFNDSVWASVRAIYNLPAWSNVDPFKLAQTRLSELVERTANQFCVGAQAEILTGRASQQISRFVAERHADLLVVGEHGEHYIEELLLGSGTQNILYHAGRDVLLVA